MNPKGGSTRRLGDVLRVQYGKALPSNQRSDSYDVPVVGSAGVMAATHTPLAEGPLVVVGRKGGVGATHLFRDGAWPLDTTYFARVPTTSLEPRFLAHQLRSMELHRLDSSTAIPSLRRQDLESQPLWIPPLEKQRQIVEILEDHLSRLDAADRSLASGMRRGKLLELAAIEDLTSADTPLVRLKDVAVSSGYGTSTKCIVDGPGVPVARIPNIIGGAVDLTDEKRSADPTVDLSGLMLDPGDVLFVRTNGSRDLIGRTAVVQPGVNASFASYLIRYKFDPSRVLPAWVRLMMERPSARVAIERLAASSAGQHNLSLGKIDQLEIPLPDVATQSMLIEKHNLAVERPRRLVAEAAKAKKRSTALRRSLLAAAFSGGLTGNEPDIGCAEETAHA